MILLECCVEQGIWKGVKRKQVTLGESAVDCVCK